MPRKRTRRRFRRELDDQEIEELFYGPGTCTFSGEGYLGRIGYDTGRAAWRDMAEAEKAQVLETMRADWERHSSQVMQAWAARDDYERDYLAVQYHGNPANPWAMEQFGTPSNAC